MCNNVDNYENKYVGMKVRLIQIEGYAMGIDRQAGSIFDVQYIYIGTTEA